MRKYWPSKQGILLNTKVAYLFNKIHLKLNYSLNNQTTTILSFDIINIQAKQELFKIIILELEILILDIIDLNLTLIDIKILSSKIFIDLINKSINSFCNYVISMNYSLYNLDYNYNLFQNSILLDKHILLEELLVYLIFGDYIHNNNHNHYLYRKTPQKYIEILLDNFIIQLGHIVFYQFIFTNKSLFNLLQFLKYSKLNNDSNISVRSLTGFKNNLMLQQLIHYYFIQPQSIYNNYYMVWIFNRQGLLYKYVYMYRDQDIKNLSRMHMIIISILELQDFLYPKIYKLISLTFLTLTYIFTYFFEKILDLFFLKLLKILKIK
uniref:Uncharacterized protein n=1 Tax=Thorea hispida TaxID=202687 RepID=A0A1C9CAK7_9FLOR|nr:hypothetical protein Thor_115 [Thorea hispida]AOM65407.1 hypothetical protein Thor_115 [Thorea hispida]ARX95777.1 hypothetical protein [Thorea hispida]UNJ79208.1 hypothetical protein [Thorea hispida]